MNLRSLWRNQLVENGKVVMNMEGKNDLNEKSLSKNGKAFFSQ